MRGVILEPKEGTAIGVIHLTNRHMVRAVKETELGNKHTELERGQNDKIFSSAVERTTLNVSSFTSDDPKKSAQVMKKRVASTGKEDDASDEEYNLDVILGKAPIRFCGAKNATGSAPGNADAGGQGGGPASGSTSSSRNKRKAQVIVELESPAKKSKTMARALKDQNTAEHLIMSATHVLKNLNDDDLVDAVTTKSLTSLVTQFDKALSTEKMKKLMELGESCGMDLISSLQHNRKICLRARQS